MSDKYKILITDDLADAGVSLLKGSGIFEIECRKKTTLDELMRILPDYHGLIIRSASKVTKEVLQKADNLKVVIRAGVGVDNIDITSCSEKGIVVMNAPAGNAISTAEHAIGFLFALARRLPQANQSMKERKWEKKKFKGLQLTGKTLGVVGLGRIGKEVVKRARGLQMRVIGHDPFIPIENLKHLQIDIVKLDELLKRSDFITVHTPLTESTRHLINSQNIGNLKKEVHLINCARGGIYEEKGVAQALANGQIAGAGFDVFTQEPPPPDFLLYDQENCIMTPHLGASTEEAQIEVAKESAASLIEYFKKGVAKNSLNFPTIDVEEMGILTPWFSLAERIGDFVAQLVSGQIQTVKLKVSGSLEKLNTKPLEIALAKGVLRPALGDEVNLVNAPVLSKERDIDIMSEKSNVKGSFDMLEILLQAGSKKYEICSTVNFGGGVIISFNSFRIEFKPEGHILFIRNDDVPKVVGELGLLLGENNINIASLQLVRENRGGLALTIIHLDSEPTQSVVGQINEKPYVKDLKYIYVP